MNLIGKQARTEFSNTPIHSNAMSRPIPKTTGKRYRTVSKMLEDAGIPQEVLDSVKEVESQELVPIGDFYGIVSILQEVPPEDW